MAIPCYLINNKTKVGECKDIVRGPGGSSLRVLGWVYIELKYNNYYYRGENLWGLHTTK